MAALDGRVALVTGAARGIGAAIAERFRAEGARVVVNDIDAAPGVDVAGSVASPADCERIVAACGGQLDILVNNAGVTRDAMVHKMSDDTWDFVVDVVLKGTFNMCRAAAPLLRERRPYHRKVVNIASINGIYGQVANANYSAAKAGVIGLTKTLSREWARNQVNVNAVAPGFIKGTRMTAPRGEGDVMGIPPDTLARIESSIPIGRVGTPEDIAAACLWLASVDSDYCTGQVIELHGGREFVEVAG